MGQKVDPRAVRLGINEKWKSVWFSDKKNYANLLEQDLVVREYVKKVLESAGVNEVIIKRFTSKITVEVHVARPGVVIGRAGAGVEKLKKNLNRMFKSKIDLKIVEVKNPDASATLIAQNVKNQLVRRIVPKYAMMRELEKVKNSGAGVKGVRIWVSGRIRGVEIARTEKMQWGTIPLSTLRARIDYAKMIAQVPNAGIQGIKVWVYWGEKSTIDE